ncbi:MAG: polysaccharide pyruvyl transferase family protein [Lachnospiraceae bacterium]|nr:polysaccharide pyruvyl transferase family protein [Lachnospiraceae bacterium]
MNYVLHEKNKCTGCSACMNICPKGAIQIVSDPGQEYGYVSIINEKLCVNCGLCTKVCPVLHKEMINTKNPDCYALYADDETLKKSASGGAFTLLAKTILSEGGCVVGAAYGSYFKVQHEMIDSESELDKLRRSKYVQSYLGTIFTDIKEELKKRTVLFVGTPCQVAGLKSFIKDDSSLIVVDLYCGHTPAYELFRRYLDETYGLENVREFHFRTKQNGWVADTVTVKLKNKETEDVLTSREDDYGKAYHNKLSMRKVCENCSFSGFPRQGDLSIADFWWIEETYPELKNSRGTSAVLVNNEKGQELFDKIKPLATLCQKVELSSMKKNRPEKVQAHEFRDRFYNLLKGKSFHESVDKALNHRYDVVLWGNWSEGNYGSELTYYALYHVLKDMNKEVLLVERPKDAIWGPNEEPVLFKHNPYPEDNYYVPEDKVDMRKLNDCSDTFMVGSDQIWHHDLYDPFGKVSYLDYIHNDKKKISYSSSFGREYWDGNETEAREVSAYLQKFNNISVRESSGVKLCQERFHVQADWVMDPLFLCDQRYFTQLADQSSLKKEHYVGVYVLDESDEKEKLLDLAESQLHIETQIISDAFVKNVSNDWKRDIIQNASMEDWISNFRHADYIITDSFHGMCLSIIFHKPFIAISNQKRGSVRFMDLMSKLGLEERLVENITDLSKVKELLSTAIDYQVVDEKLRVQINRSRTWLVDALDKPLEDKEFPIDSEVLLQRRLDELEFKLDTFMKETQKIQDWHTERLDYHDKIQDWHTLRLDQLENWRSAVESRSKKDEVVDMFNHFLRKKD